MSKARIILVTGATGKVGQLFIKRLLAEPKFGSVIVRALCHNRELEAHERIQIVHGSLEHRETVEKSLDGVTHVVHLATCKETPNQIMDVAVKGMFWLLETCRTSSTFQQFILVGGDASVGHFVYPHPIPVTETQKHTAYPGCYALSKVLEEVMLEQYFIQYDVNGCCLRAPWIMEKDDFKYQLSFGEGVFGGPRWRDLVGDQQADEYVRTQTIPVMLDPDGRPVKRNFIHIDDLVSALLLIIDHPQARQQLFNISMDEPVDYGEMSRYLTASRGLPAVEIKTDYHSTWLDNTKAKLVLGWRPEYDLKRMVDSAWDYERAKDDPRKIWYPG
ncbi:MAG TPA: NAD(P)-dependent oxidoreductase [Anaerolineales bacterium]|nr:NAD(P)-dependent oxidoreductase [Anaerolineales bacterium]